MMPQVGTHLHPKGTGKFIVLLLFFLWRLAAMLPELSCILLELVKAAEHCPHCCTCVSYLECNLFCHLLSCTSSKCPSLSAAPSLSADRMSVLNNAVLTFTPTSWSTVQTLRLSVVRNRPTGERGKGKRMCKFGWRVQVSFTTSSALAATGLGLQRV